MKSYDYLTSTLNLNNETKKSIFNSIIQEMWKGANIEDIKFLTNGRINSVYRILLNNAPVSSMILRICYMNDSRYKQGFACESWISNLLEKANLKIAPRLYKYDSYQGRVNFDYSIYEEVYGENLNEHHSNSHFFNAGEILAKIHEIDLNFFGKNKHSNIDRADIFYENYFNNVLKLLKERDYSMFTKVREVIKKYYHKEAYRKLKPVLLHHDYHIKNIMINNQNNIFVIDWDSARGGIAELDFLKIKYLSFKKMDLTKVHSFFDGYENVKKINLSINFPLQELIWLCKIYLFENDWALGRDEKYFPNAEIYKKRIDKFIENYQYIYEYVKYVQSRNVDCMFNTFWRNEFEV